MKQILKYITCLFIFLFYTTVLSQGVNSNYQKERFTIKGSVIERDTNMPIPRVNIEVNGGSYTTTDSQGEFRIEVSLGDELVIRHSGFETVYYIIKSNERIRVEVEPSNQSKIDFKISKRINPEEFENLIDSSKHYIKQDAEKSISFITEALVLSTSTKQNASVYENLADIYYEWKQYDLAITNYKISLQNVKNNRVKLKLANSYEKNKNYQESIEAFNNIEKNELSNWQLTILYEGLGDVYNNTGDYSLAIESYTKGLDVAREHLITPKVTDLNSKIAETYNRKGELEVARGYFSNSLKLAESENKTRAVQEKVKVADFQNKNRAYDDEIELRKEALEVIEDIESDSLFDNTSALTPQKQNYKIGNAYALQRDYINAIPYLEKSISEADSKEDLVVKKDATRKLAEVFRDAGDLENAVNTSKVYEGIVDELYARKEQEISQSARFRSDLKDKQSRITSLEKDREISESKYQLTTARSKNQQIIIYSLVGGLLLLLAVAYFMFKNIKQQRLNNNLLALKSLRSQMNPHFIFNALNSVNSFIATNDERTANRYLTDFSLLMRAVLENSEEDFISLEKEIELLQLYTKLEHFRFQDKFDYDITVENNVKVEEFQIPPMLLQPYIENAVWHGLRYKTEKGKLLINISQSQKDQIKISIIDDGIGREKSKTLKTQHQKKQNSKGMGNIKKRVAILNKMYKDKVDVFIDDYQATQEDIGTKVEVTLKKD